MRLCASVSLRPAVARIKIHVKTRAGWRLGTLVLCLFLADALRLSPVFRKRAGRWSCPARFLKSGGASGLLFGTQGTN